ncbi:MAG: hypothetical protein ACTS77_01445 [Arsenophonus sp. NC-TX2-MAG3]
MTTIRSVFPIDAVSQITSQGAFIKAGFADNDDKTAIVGGVLVQRLAHITAFRGVKKHLHTPLLWPGYEIGREAEKYFLLASSNACFLSNIVSTHC